MLEGLRQSGSLKLVFPRRSAAGLEGVIVNTAGGLTGGDRFCIKAKVRAETELTLTTQAAERAYRAQPGEIAELETCISVEAGARLNWLPQETLIFQRSAFKREIKIHLEPSAQMLLCEPVIFGRQAMGETAIEALFHDRILVHHEERPIYFDQLRLDGNVTSLLSRQHTAGGATSFATVVYVGPDAESHLTFIREIPCTTLGASLMAEDVLVVRVLASDGFEMRKLLFPILRQLRRGDLPRPWMI